MNKYEKEELLIYLNDNPDFKKILTEKILTKSGVVFTEALQKHDKNYMNLAEQVALTSKCNRAKYGSVIISKDGRVITTAYNGKPRGSCNDCICYREGLPPNSPKENCCIHSETNALLFSSSNDRELGTIYVSGVPCNDCALLIMNSGLLRVVYQTKPNILNGHVGSSDEEYWKKYNVSIEVSHFDEEKWKKFYNYE